MIICLKGISQGKVFHLMVQWECLINNACLKFLTKMPTQKAIQSLQKSNLDSQSQKFLTSVFSFCFKIKFFKVLSSIFSFAHIHKRSFNAYDCAPITCDQTFGNAKLTWRVSEDPETFKALRRHSGTWALVLSQETQTYGHSEGTRMALKALGQSSTWALEAFCLAESTFFLRIRALFSNFKIRSERPPPTPHQLRP